VPCPGATCRHVRVIAGILEQLRQGDHPVVEVAFVAVYAPLVGRVHSSMLPRPFWWVSTPLSSTDRVGEQLAFV